MSTETLDTAELLLEMRDLKNQIGALRNELEAANAGTEMAVNRAVSESNAESAQLRATVAVLRDEIEVARADTHQAVASALAEGQGEIGQLKQTILALREELEKEHARRDDMVRMAKSDLTIRTALLEGRYVWGDQALFEEGQRRFWTEVVAGTERQFVAAKLAERGLIAKRTDPADGRKVLLAMTPAGEALARSLAPYQQQINDVLFECFDRRRFEALAAMAGDMVASGDRAVALSEFLVAQVSQRPAARAA